MMCLFITLISLDCIYLWWLVWLIIHLISYWNWHRMWWEIMWLRCNIVRIESYCLYLESHGGALWMRKYMKCIMWKCCHLLLKVLWVDCLLRIKMVFMRYIIWMGWIHWFVIKKIIIGILNWRVNSLRMYLECGVRIRLFRLDRRRMLKRIKRLNGLWGMLLETLISKSVDHH
jgi:hypothetical protein